jgi:hypothetical protein
VGTPFVPKRGVINPITRAAAMPSIIHLGAAAIERTTSEVCMPADAMSGAGGNRAINRPAIVVASSNDERMSGKPTSA